VAETKRKPSAKKGPSSKRGAGRVPAPTLEDALLWIGLRVDDWSGHSLGKVSGIHVDSESRDPKWVIVRMGRFAGEAALPFAHVAEAGGRLWAAYEREDMRRSPKLSSDQPLSGRQELQLCEHYGMGIGAGRAAELVKREGEDMTAVPAQPG
jgi:hypothetical protein